MIVSYFYSTPHESFFQKCVKKKEKKKYNHLNSKRRVRLKVASNTKRYRKQVERASLRRPRRPSSHLSPLPDYCSCFSSTLLDPLFLSCHAKNVREREEEREKEKRNRQRRGANFRERSLNNEPVERIGSTYFQQVWNRAGFRGEVKPRSFSINFLRKVSQRWRNSGIKRGG